ncbi:MAG: NAD(P)/FAD-dependent oxidoreductase [Caldilineaceae bacterium]|nr:NAD(P)/FAD-dependent oxidoreductase [Caldilineaceae bacterium]MCB9119643.1 NAD(P)/FAD-dependent oxidoreductase [Caldilineaceae bacterium]MCB9124320.1 NAD(P)/FAD-dependent oxidoreductase [Caldilineaceae bacterium]
MLYDVLIIGGGIVGCAIARELTRYRLRVALCEKEREVGFGTTKANSGIIHGGHHAAPGTLKGRLEWAGNQRWDRLAAELGFGFRRVGELTVARSAAEFPTLDKLLHHATVKRIPGVERWEAERIRREEPALSPTVLAAVYAPTTGVVNPYEACYGLAESAVRNGLDLLTGFPVERLHQEDGLWVVLTPTVVLQARFVINAAGIDADRVAASALAGNFDIRPRKGEEYLLDKRLQGLVKRVIFPCPTAVSKGILVIPTFDGTIMVGPTAEEAGDRTDLTTSTPGARAVFDAVRDLVPGISEKDVIAQFAGLRAVATGEDFIIGPTSRRGFINAAGIQSPGLTAAPAIAELVVDVLRDEGLTLVERDDFMPALPRPVHFAALSTMEQIALSLRDPRYRRIVCRCEYVTEGEVLDAIARGAATLDGIKFRTRAGMGRCQGGFCTVRCMELLARSRGMDMASVTKRGRGSWLVYERNGGTLRSSDSAPEDEQERMGGEA